MAQANDNERFYKPPAIKPAPVVTKKPVTLPAKPQAGRNRRFWETDEFNSYAEQVKAQTQQTKVAQAQAYNEEHKPPAPVWDRTFTPKAAVYWNPTTKMYTPDASQEPVFLLTSMADPNAGVLIRGKREAKQRAKEENLVVNQMIFDDRTELFFKSLEDDSEPDTSKIVSSYITDLSQSQLTSYMTQPYIPVQPFDQDLLKGKTEEQINEIVSALEKQGYKFTTYGQMSEEEQAKAESIVGGSVEAESKYGAFKKILPEDWWLTKQTTPGDAETFTIFAPNARTGEMEPVLLTKRLSSKLIDAQNVVNTSFGLLFDVSSLRSPILVAAEKNPSFGLVKHVFADTFLNIGKSITSIWDKDSRKIHYWDNQWKYIKEDWKATIDLIMSRDPTDKRQMVTPSWVGEFINTPEEIRIANEKATAYRQLAQQALARGDGQSALNYTREAQAQDRSIGKVLSAASAPDNTPVSGVANWSAKQMNAVGNTFENALASVGYGAYESWTWDIMPEREEMFLNAIAGAELQVGRPLTFEEINTLRNKYADGTVEMVGDVVFDPTTWTGLGAGDAVILGIKKFAKKTDVEILAPLMNKIKLPVRASKGVILAEEITKGAGVTLARAIDDPMVKIGLHTFLEEWSKKLSIRSAALHLGQTTTRIATYLADNVRLSVRNIGNVDFASMVENIAKHAGDLDELSGAVKNEVDNLPHMPQAHVKSWVDLVNRLGGGNAEVGAQKAVTIARKAQEDVFKDTIIQTQTKLENQIFGGAAKGDLATNMEKRWASTLINRNGTDMFGKEAGEWFQKKIVQRAKELMSETVGRFSNLDEAIKYATNELQTTGIAATYYRNAFLKELISAEATRQATASAKNAQKLAIRFGEDVRLAWLNDVGQRAWTSSDVVTDSFLSWLDRRLPGVITSGIKEGTTEGLTGVGKALLSIRNVYLTSLRFIFANVLSGRPGYLMTNYIDTNFRALVLGVNLRTSFPEILNYYKARGMSLPVEIYQSLAKDMVADPEGTVSKLINGSFEVQKFHLLNWKNLYSYYWAEMGRKELVASGEYGKMLKQSTEVGKTGGKALKAIRDVAGQIARPFRAFYSTNADFNNITEVVARARTYHSFYLKGKKATEAAFMNKFYKFIPEEKKALFDALYSAANDNPTRLLEMIKRKDGDVLFSQFVPKPVQEFLADMEPVQAANYAGWILQNLEDAAVKSKGFPREVLADNIRKVLETAAEDLEAESSVKLRYLAGLQDQAVDHIGPITNTTEAFENVLGEANRMDEALPSTTLIDLQKRVEDVGGDAIPDEEIADALKKADVKIRKGESPRNALKNAVEAPTKALKQTKTVAESIKPFSATVSASLDKAEEELAAEASAHGLSITAQKASQRSREITNAAFKNAFGFKNSGSMEDLEFLNNLITTHAETLDTVDRIRRFVTETPGVMEWPKLTGDQREIAFGRFDRWLTQARDMISAKFTRFNEEALSGSTKAPTRNLAQDLTDLRIKLHYDGGTWKEIEITDVPVNDIQMASIHIRDEKSIQKFRDMLFGEYDHSMNDLTLVAQNKIGLNLHDIQRDFKLGQMPNIRIDVTGNEVKANKGFMVWSGKDVPNLKEAVKSAMHIWNLPEMPSDSKTFKFIRDAAISTAHPKAALVNAATDYDTLLNIFADDTKGLADLTAIAGNKLAQEGKPRLISQAATELRAEVKKNLMQAGFTKDGATASMQAARKALTVQAAVLGISEDEYWLTRLMGLTTRTVNTTPMLLMAEDGAMVAHLPILNLFQDQLRKASFKNGQEVLDLIANGGIRGLKTTDVNFKGILDWVQERIDKPIDSQELLDVIKDNETKALKITSRVNYYSENALENMAKKYYGVTEDIRSAGYILRDGTQLDLGKTSKVAKEGLGMNGLVADHGPAFLFDADEIKNDEVLFYMSHYEDRFRGQVMEKTGMIRMNYNANTLEIASEVTPDQKAFIAEWFSRRPETGYIDVRLPDGTVKSFTFADKSPVEISRLINDINTGFKDAENSLFMAASGDMPDWLHPPTPEQLDELFSLDTFKTWDGGNALRSNDGRVKIYHHGTGQYGFPEFNWNKVGQNNLYGPGFYFTENEDIAKSYMTKSKHPKVLGVYDTVLRTKNPLRWNVWDEVDKFMGRLTKMVDAPDAKLVDMFMKHGSTLEEAENAVDVIKNNMSKIKSWVTKVPDKKELVQQVKNTLNGKLTPDGLVMANGFTIPWLRGESGPEMYIKINDYVSVSLFHDVEANKYIFGVNTPTLNPASYAKFGAIDDGNNLSGLIARISEIMSDEVSLQGKGFRTFVQQQMSQGTSVEKAMSIIMGDGFTYNLSYMAKALGHDAIIHTGGQLMGGELHEVVISLDPKSIKSIFNDGTFSETSRVLHLNAGEKVFGSTQFLKNGKALIQLSTDAKSPATFIHELAHVIMPDITRDDFDQLAEWATRKSNGYASKKITHLEFKELHQKVQILGTANKQEAKLYKEYQEAFANGWTKHFITQETEDLPTGLKALYNRIRKALGEFYETYIRGSALDVKLSKEMRDMYTRLSGGGQDIKVSSEAYSNGRKAMRKGLDGTRIYATYESYRRALKETLRGVIPDDSLDKYVDDYLAKGTIHNDAEMLADNERIINGYIEEPARAKVRELLKEGKEPTMANAYRKGRKGVSWVDQNGVAGFTPLVDEDYAIGRAVKEADIDPAWDAIIANHDLKGFQMDLSTPEKFLDEARKMVKMFTEKGTEGDLVHADAWSSIIADVERDLNLLPTPEDNLLQWIDSVPRVRMKEGMRTYVTIAQNDVKQLKQAQEMLIKWKDYFEEEFGKTESTSWFFADHTEEWWKSLEEPVQNIANEMTKLEDILKFGGNYEGIDLQGAVAQTNRGMIDYTTNYAWEYIPRQIFPFWQFPSRSIPFWAETIVSHPEIVRYYQMYLLSSWRQRMQNGMVNSKGEPLKSYAGYVNIPGTDYWFNPTAPLSFRILFPSVYEGQDDQQEGEISPTTAAIRNVVETTSLRGVGINPILSSILRVLGHIDEQTQLRNSIIPQVDLVPRTLQRSVLSLLRKNVWPNAPELWSPEVSYKDALIENIMYKDTLQQLNALKAENPIEADYLQQAYDVVQQVKTVMELSPTERRTNDLWIKYRKEYEAGQYGKNLTGFFTSVYGKAYTDADSQFNALRNEVNLLKSALNNAAQREIFDLASDPYQMTEVYRQKRYDTPEGELWNISRTSSWVTDDSGNSLTGDARVEQIAKNLSISDAWEAYYNSIELVYKERNERLAKLPVGAPSNLKSDIYAQAEEKLSHITPPNMKDPSIFGKTPESLFQEFEKRWWRDIVSSEPYYDRDGTMSYADWKKKHDEWLADLPMAAQAIRTQFLASIRPQIEQMNFPTLAPEESPTGMDAKTAFMAKLTDQLMQNTNAQGLTAYKRTSDTAYDALTEAWLDLYYSKYLELTEDKKNEEFTLAERQFKAENPTPPSFDDMVTWIQMNYPTGRFSLEELRKAWNEPEDTPLTVEERQAESRDANETIRNQIFTIMKMVGPGNEYGSFIDIFKSPMVGGTQDELDELYDKASGMTPEELNALLAKVTKAASIVGASEPTDAELAVRAQARVDDDEFKALVTSTLGSDFYNLRDWYYGLDYAQQAGAKKLYPDLVKKLEQYKQLRAFFAETHQGWAQFYGPTTASTGTGSSGGGGGTSGGGRKATVTSRASSAPWRYQKPYGMVTSPYRTTLNVMKLLGGELLGKGGAGGIPTWPKEKIAELEFSVWEDSWPDEVRTALGDTLITALKNKYIYGEALSAPALDFINGLIERHPDWAPALRAIAQ